MTRVAILLAAATMLSGCAGGPPGAGHARAVSNELDPSGRPYVGPSVPVSNPPADNGTPRLSCHPEGIGEQCDRTS